MNLFYAFWRDMHHNALVAWSYQQIDASSFLGWTPDAGTMVGVPRIAGC